MNWCCWARRSFPALLTEKGTEFCGRADEHDCQLFLAINDIDHTKTKVKHPRDPLFKSAVDIDR
jgi:hypothetical protein